MAPKMKALRIGGRALHRRRDRQGRRRGQGRTELEALIAYLQVLGTAGK
jgi:cbb3-type cytochrome oxidase cytochrome c subunit